MGRRGDQGHGTDAPIGIEEDFELDAAGQPLPPRRQRIDDVLLDEPAEAREIRPELGGRIATIGSGLGQGLRGAARTAARL